MKVNGKDYPIYEMENKIHVWNYQPASFQQKISFFLMAHFLLYAGSKPW
jgi:hypothetical protein